MINYNKKIFVTASGSKHLGLVGLFLFFSFFANAQNTSYNLNSIPITGNANSIFGFQSFLNNTTGGNNSGFGNNSLKYNTTGYGNSAFGYFSLFGNITGSNNTAIGNGALFQPQYTNMNTAVGFASMNGGTQDSYQNTAIGGYASLYSAGYNNSSMGYYTLLNNLTGNSLTVLGAMSDVGLSNLTNATALGYGAVVNSSNTIQLGNSNVTTVYAGTGTNAKLIAGGLQITGGILTAGNVLTSDGAGNAIWQTPSGGGAVGWSLTGNAGTVDGTNFIGTTDNIPFNIRVNNETAGRIDPIRYNTFYGHKSGEANYFNSGYENSFYGFASGQDNVSGNLNTAFGSQSLRSNTSGGTNTAIGSQALFYNISGNNNQAFGTGALLINKSGGNNLGVGYGALAVNETGNYNTGLGNTNVAFDGLINAAAIGSNAIVNASNKIRFGDATVTVVEGPVAYTISDGRFKNNISETDVKGLEFINKLRPVVYNFDSKKFTEFLTQHMPDTISSKYLNKDFNPSTAIRQSGFIAQEVEKAAQEVGYDFNGVHLPQNKDDNYSLAYSEFVVPLVKAVQELSAQNQNLKQNYDKQNQINESLKKDMAELRTIVSTLKNNNIEGSITIAEVGKDAKLYQNAPNPFNNMTTIRYSIPENSKRAIITITTLDGRKIKTFELNSKNGEKLEISGGQLSAGTYIYSLSVDNIFVDSKKMILTK